MDHGHLHLLKYYHIPNFMNSLIPLNKTIALFLLLSNVYVNAGTISHKEPGFLISKSILNSKHIHYSFKEYKDDKFLDTSVAAFDVEELSLEKNAKILFSKSSFTIKKNISKVDTSIFSDTSTIKKLMGASKLVRHQENENIWSSTIPVMIYNVKSDLEVRQHDSDDLENDVFMDYYLAVDQFDQNLDQAQYQVHIRLTDFNQAFDSLTIICKFIPYGNKTVVVSYFIAKSNKKWWSKRNLFGVATSKVKSIILNVLKDTKATLE
mgnify:CR=1 FL=1